VVVKSSGPSSTCIDLTEDAANDIIIEKSVGIKQKKRSLPYKNKIRAPTNNLNATIVIDDDRYFLNIKMFSNLSSNRHNLSIFFVHVYSKMLHAIKQQYEILYQTPLSFLRA